MVVTVGIKGVVTAAVVMVILKMMIKPVTTIRCHPWALPAVGVITI